MMKLKYLRTGNAVYLYLVDFLPVKMGDPLVTFHKAKRKVHRWDDTVRGLAGDPISNWTESPTTKVILR